MAGIVGMRQGQGSRLSARVVDDASFGTPCARARGGGGTLLSPPILSKARFARFSVKRMGFAIAARQHGGWVRWLPA